MGEEKKEEPKKEEKEDDTTKKEKKEEEDQEIVLKVDMHCEACARKVARALKGFEGVSDVTADYKASRVVVKGGSSNAVDPLKLCQRLQKKSRKKVEIISPLPKPPQPPPPPGEEGKEDPNKGQQQPKQEVIQPPAVVTIVLRVRMHCEACAQALQKKIGKVKGVESVTADVANDQVTVKGVLEPEKLVKDIYKKTGKQASIVKDEEKKAEEKKEEKKEEKQPEEEKKQESKEGDDDDDDKKSEVKKNEYLPPKYYMDHAYYYGPQMFSDENPNACSVM